MALVPGRTDEVRSLKCSVEADEQSKGRGHRVL